MNSGDGDGMIAQAAEVMEVNGDGGGDSIAVKKSFSVPEFLRKVFTEELGYADGRDHKLIVTAIHAVLLESGFVRFDVNSNDRISEFQFLADEWPSTCFRLSLFYTLPEIINGHAGGGDPVDCVVLKFQSLGKYITVYGSVANGAGGQQCGTHCLRLNEDELVPVLNVVWANCNISGSEKDVFTFWRNVKDSFALPLLIDLREKTELQLPPFLMQLPSDVMRKILELLPGEDVAKVSCVCWELRYLGSSNSLWKLKYAEQIGDQGKLKSASADWKKAYVALRSWRKIIKLANMHISQKRRMVAPPSDLYRKTRSRRD